MSKERIAELEEAMIMSIDSDAFAEVRLSFDRILNTVFKKMKLRDSDKAGITINVEIALKDIKTTDTRTGEIMHVKNPEIKYTIKHKLEYKNEESEGGEIQRADSYLVCEDGQWKIKPIENGQMTVNDYIKGKKK